MQRCVIQLGKRPRGISAAVPNDLGWEFLLVMRHVKVVSNGGGLEAFDAEDGRIRHDEVMGDVELRVCGFAGSRVCGYEYCLGRGILKLAGRRGDGEEHPKCRPMPAPRKRQMQSVI